MSGLLIRIEKNVRKMKSINGGSRIVNDEESRCKERGPCTRDPTTHFQEEKRNPSKVNDL